MNRTSRNALGILATLAFYLLGTADTIHLENGDSVSGRLSGMQAGFVILEIDTHATRRIDPNQVAALEFDDQTDNLETTALRRSPFLGLLSKADERQLPNLLDSYLQQDRPLEALSYAKLWHPKINYEANRDRIALTLIHSSEAAGFHEEAAAHAQAWIDQHPVPEQSALPWAVLAKSNLDQGKPEAALWIALAPLAYAHGTETPERRTCQEIANEAYRQLGYEAGQPLRLPSLFENPLTFTDLLKMPLPQ